MSTKPERSLRTGDVVVYDGPLSAYHGRVGTVTSIHPDVWVSVCLDGERRSRSFKITSLKLKGNSMNFKVQIQTAVDDILASYGSPKEDAVRRLGVGYELSKHGDKLKKEAKQDLINLGVIADTYAPGAVIVFDNETYLVNAKTKEPAVRLDRTELVHAMAKEGLSLAKINRILEAASVTNKPATTFEVIQK